MAPRSQKDPIPAKNRKARNIPMWTELARRAPEITTSEAAIVMLILRPKASATQEMQMAPKKAPAWKRPFIPEIKEVASGRVWSSKYSKNVG